MALDFPNSPTDGQVHTDGSESFKWDATHQTWRRFSTALIGPPGPEGPTGPPGDLSGFKNQYINGAFDVWQRATSQSGGGYGSADRWTISGATLFARLSNTLGGGASYMGNYIGGGTGYIRQNIENAAQFVVGDEWTLSFLSSASEHRFDHGPNGGTFSGHLAMTNVSGNLWSVTFPIIDAGLGASSYETYILSTTLDWNITDIQLEKGDTVTQFERRPLAVEEPLCYRYYVRLGASNSVGRIFGSGYMVSSSTARFLVPLPTNMRANPQILLASTTSRVLAAGTADSTVRQSDLSILNRRPHGLVIYVQNLTGFSGTNNHAAIFYSGSSGDQDLRFDSEL